MDPRMFFREPVTLQDIEDEHDLLYGRPGYATTTNLGWLDPQSTKIIQAGWGRHSEQPEVHSMADALAMKQSEQRDRQAMQRAPGDRFRPYQQRRRQRG